MFPADYRPHSDCHALGTAPVDRALKILWVFSVSRGPASQVGLSPVFLLLSGLPLRATWLVQYRAISFTQLVDTVMRSVSLLGVQIMDQACHRNVHAYVGLLVPHAL